MAYSDLPLPQNLDAERALLGAILEDNDALFDANKVLADLDFFEPWNANAYNLLRDQIEPGGRVSAATLLHDLSQNAIVDSDLTATDVIKILVREAVPRSEVSTLAETIRELSRRRLAIAAFEQAAADLRAAPASVPASEIRNKLDSDITALYASVAEFGIRLLPEAGDDLIKRLGAQMNSDNEIGIPLGLAMVEDLTGSLLPEEVTVLAGPSGSGKSALGQQIGDYASMKGFFVLMEQLEMNARQVAQRAMTARTAIPGKRIARGRINDEELRRLFEANESTRAARFYIDDSASLTAEAIRYKAIRQKRIIGLDLLIIDHLQYVQKPDWKMSDVEAVGPNLRAFKRLAKELKIPVLVLAQLKAGFSEGPLRRPTISDLWNSSAVEQNADVVFFVHRPEYMLRRKEPMKDADDRGDWEIKVERWKNKAEIILGKLREGVGYGVNEMAFDPSRVRFSDNVQDAYRVADDGRLPF